MTTLVLPYPKLAKGRFASIVAYSDEALFEATGVRIAFTCRSGGVSSGAYASLNLGTHVNDCRSKVEENRRRVLQGLATPDTCLLVPNQVHGDVVATLDSSADLSQISLDIEKGADVHGFQLFKKQGIDRGIHGFRELMPAGSQVCSGRLL